MEPIDDETLADLWQDIADRRWKGYDYEGDRRAEMAVDIFRHKLDTSVAGLANVLTKQANREYAYRTMDFPSIVPGHLDDELAVND